MDSAYFIDRTEFYQLDFISSLTNWMGKSWYDVFGRTIVSSRCLSWLCYSVAMVAPFVTLQNRKMIWENLPYLAIGFLMLGGGGTFVYDVSTVLFSSIITIFLIKYIHHPSNLLLVLLAFACAMSSCARFSNILILPIVSLFLFLYRKDKKMKLGRTLLTAGSFVIVFFIFYAILLYAVTGEKDLVAFAVDGVVNQNLGPTHQLGNLLERYKSSYLSTLGYFANILLVCFLLKQVSLKIPTFCYRHLSVTSAQKKYISGIFLLFVFCSLFLILKATIYVAYIYCAVYGFLFIFLQGILFYREEKSCVKIVYVIFFVLCVIGIAGSDTGMIKLVHYAKVMTPILLCSLKKSKLLKDKFNVVILTTFVIFSMYAKSNEFRFNKEYISESNFFSHLLIKNEEKMQYEKLIRTAQKYGKKGKNIFYGRISGHLSYALTDQVPPYFCSYFMDKNDFKELGTIVDLMKVDSSRVLFDYTKSNVSYFKKHHLRLIVSNDDCNIYKR